jgi:hypothetical protein
VLIGILCERIEKWETSPILKEYRSLVGSDSYVSIHESWEDISREEQWAKVHIDKRRSSYVEKNCFLKSQNYCTGDSRTEYSSSTKTV